MALAKVPDNIIRKEQQILWKYFRKGNNAEIATWVRQNASELSNTAWSATLHQAKPTAVRTLLIMCHELHVPIPEVKKMLTARGERTIARMLKDE